MAKSKEGLTPKGLGMIRSQAERQCPVCLKKGALELVVSGKGYWLKKCRYCKYIKYWYSTRLYTSMPEIIRSKLETGETK